MSTTIVYHKFHCYCTHFLCFHSKITMLFFSCARDENFQIKKYIIPVLTIYLVPLLLFYLNLLPLPRSRSSYMKSRTNETQNIPIVEKKRTICGNEPLYYKKADEKGIFRSVEFQYSWKKCVSRETSHLRPTRLIGAPMRGTAL